MPKLSFMTFTTGARQLVVQLAFVTIRLSLFKMEWLQPKTMFWTPASFTGAETTTLLMPHLV